MTKRDLFRLIIKLFGLYCFIATMFNAFPSAISWFSMNEGISGIGYLIGVAVFLVFLFIFLISNPDKIIDFCKLDKGFDEERIDFQQFNSSNILKLGIIIAGLVLLVENTPLFISYLFTSFKNTVDNDLTITDPKDTLYMALSFVNLLLGYWMITQYEMIGKFLDSIHKK